MLTCEVGKEGRPVAVERDNFYHLVSFSLFKSWTVSTPWRREACAEPRDHRSQQPPDGGQAHHWEAPRRQRKNVAPENQIKHVTPSFASSVVNEDPALNIKSTHDCGCGNNLSSGPWFLTITTFVVSTCEILFTLKCIFLGAAMKLVHNSDIIQNDASDFVFIKHYVLFSLNHAGPAAALQEMYRKDCNLAAQLLQCNKSLYRAQLSEVRPVLFHCTLKAFLLSVTLIYFCLLLSGLVRLARISITFFSLVTVSWIMMQ